MIGALRKYAKRNKRSKYSTAMSGRVAVIKQRARLKGMERQRNPDIGDTLVSTGVSFAFYIPIADTASGLLSSAAKTNAAHSTKAA